MKKLYGLLLSFRILVLVVLPLLPLLRMLRRVQKAMEEIVDSGFAAMDTEIQLGNDVAMQR